MLCNRMFRSGSSRETHQSTPEKMEVNGSQKADNTAASKPVGDIEVDNSATVLLKIATLYAERLMSDICLLVGGNEYPAHRLILCASSEVFQVMLMNPEWSESQESCVVLQETPACAAIFGDFLRYFYTGQIRINHLIVMPVLALADKYNVKDLVKLCIEYMCEHIAHAAANNQLISWLQYTLTCGHYQVAQVCQNFVKWNLELVAETTDFGNFEPEILVSLLQQNDLVVHNEMALYSCVVKWLDLQKERLSQDSSNTIEDINAHMEQLVVEVMSHVRFPMMSPRQLAELLLSPLTKTYKEFFVERMAIGMSFHSGQTERVQEVLQTDEGRLLFTPRLYTADTWSTLLSVENVPLLPAYHTCTLVFSSRSSLAEHAGDHACEWVVDVYPKGVWFRKFYLIVWQGTVEVPESVLRTVRLSVMCRDPPPAGHTRVKVGILIRGVQDGVEHIRTVIERNHHFGETDKVLNFDDLLSFDELNSPPGGTSGSGSSSPYLVGRNRDILKLHIVIAPLSDVCSTTAPSFTIK
ncbi:BTB/POZ domain-containing protein 17 isoform X3 [Periplaneta americana]|uniref:BTB/POZ domain-containing protein 17 isoform X3 n=1 Tax=Periplaneta americana TaxID=6978 RepID=UPI0037E79BB8